MADDSSGATAARTQLLTAVGAAPRRSALGAGAVLFDMVQAGEGEAPGGFRIEVQRRIWAAAAALRGVTGVEEAVPGMNNLLVTYDPLRLEQGALEAAFDAAWDATHAVGQEGVAAAAAAGAAPVARIVEIPVHYGGSFGEDLAGLARHAGLAVEEVIALHSGAEYCVAAVGAMAGFPYLSGLDARIAKGRRAVPRGRVEEGAVMIGGAQAGIMPCTAPSGWHIIGRTGIRLFDPAAAAPSLLRPGDIVRFTVAGIGK